MRDYNERSAQIIKADDLNANDLLKTNTFEIGHGWLNIPVEIIHGILHVQFKDSITYQQLISTDLDVLPMHRRREHDQWSPWGNAQLQALPINKKIGSLLTENIQIRKLITENTNSFGTMEKLFDAKLYELERSFSIMQTLIAEATDATSNHSLEVETLKSDLHNTVLNSFEQELEQFKKLIDTLIQDTDLDLEDLINTKSATFQKTFDTMDNNIQKLFKDVQEELIKNDLIITKNVKEFKEFERIQLLSNTQHKEDMQKLFNDLKELIDAKIQESSDSIINTSNEQVTRDINIYKELEKSFADKVEKYDSIFKTYTKALESKIKKQVQDTLTDVGFDSTYVKADDLEDVLKSLQNKVDKSLTAVIIDSTQSIEEQMIVARRTIKEEIDLNYNNVQEIFEKIDERGSFKIKQLQDQIDALTTELRVTKSLAQSKNMAQFVILVEKRLKNLEQK